VDEKAEQDYEGCVPTLGDGGNIVIELFQCASDV